MKKEMISAVELYNKTFDNNDNYLSSAIFEEAKELIIKQLNSSNLEVVNNKDMWHDYTSISAIIAKTPKNKYNHNKDVPGVGEYKRWYVLWYLNRKKFPMNELNDWLKNFGWTLDIIGDDIYFEVRLTSVEFNTDVLKTEYWRKKRNYWPKYM